MSNINKCRDCECFLRGLATRDGQAVCGGQGRAAVAVRANQPACDKFKARTKAK